MFLKPQLFLHESAFLAHESIDSESCHRNRIFMKPSKESDLTDMRFQNCPYLCGQGLN